MGYDPATDHEALFTITPPSGGGPEMARRSAPAVARGLCPECHHRGTIGIVRQGEHHVWRLHRKTTMSGAGMDCHASGAPICTAKPRALKGVTTPSCPCETPT